jgi:hypothetical protein
VCKLEDVVDDTPLMEIIQCIERRDKADYVVAVVLILIAMATIVYHTVDTGFVIT